MRWLAIAGSTILFSCATSQDGANADESPMGAGGGDLGGSMGSGASGDLGIAGDTGPVASAGGSGSTSGNAGNKTSPGTDGGGGSGGSGGTSAHGGSGGTTDGGGFGGTPVLPTGSWVDITPPGILPKNDPHFMLGQGVTVDPNRPSTLWWCNSNFNITGALYKSTDAGATWAKVGPFDDPIHVRIDPKNSLNMYVADGVRGNTEGFWISRDGGNTWARPTAYVAAAQTIGCSDVYEASVDPSDFKHVLLSFHCNWYGGATGQAGVLESLDAGDSWTIHPPISGVSNNGGYGVYFLSDPALGIGDSKTWLFCTQAGGAGDGWYRTTDAGAHWKQVSTIPMAHGGNQLYYNKAGTLFAGGMGSGPSPMRSTDNGATWQGSNANMRVIGIIGDGSFLYTGAFNASGPFFTSPETDGLTWTVYNKGAQSFSSGPFTMALDSMNHILYASTPGDGLWALRLR